MAKVKTKFFWKGRRVTEKVYKARKNQQKAGINYRKMCGAKVCEHNLGNKCGSQFYNNKLEYEGRRLYHTKTLAEGLICKKCNAVLSLLDMCEEKQHGLASLLYIVCRQCKQINQVSTDKQHTANGKKHFDCNTKALIGE